MKAGKKFATTIAAAICFVLLFALLLSSVFVALEAEHDCVGEGCLVCQAVSAIEKTLEKLFLALSFALAVGCLRLAGGAVCRLVLCHVPASNPVALRVKLSN